MQIWVIILAAAVGAGAALAGQKLNDIWSRRRDRDAEIRAAAALLLARGRTIRDYVRRTRGMIEPNQEAVDETFAVFVQASYVLRWLGVSDIRNIVIAYADATASLVDNRTAHTPEFLDKQVVDLDKKVVDVVQRHLDRPGEVTLAVRTQAQRLTRFSRRNLPSSG